MRTGLEGKSLRGRGTENTVIREDQKVDGGSTSKSSIKQSSDTVRSEISQELKDRTQRTLKESLK